MIRPKFVKFFAAALLLLQLAASNPDSNEQKGLQAIQESRLQIGAAESN